MIWCSTIDEARITGFGWPYLPIGIIVQSKAGRYSIGIVLPTQNWTILGFPNIGFTSQYNTNTIKKMVDEEEEEEENQKESSRLGQIDGL